MSEELLLRCYEDAALQHHLMQPMAEQTGGRVFYAVDSNVVYSYLNPDEHRDSQSLDVGRFFHFDDEGTRNALAGRLMTRVMEGLSPDHPLIMVTPIHGETKKALDVFLQQAAGVTDKAAREARRMYDRLSDVLGNELPITREQIERALLQSSRDILERFQRLVRHRRLLPEARVNALTHSAELAGAIAPSRSIEEMFQFSQRKLAWQERLLRIGRQETPLSEHDAIALTQIELVNERLGAMSSDQRLHYITQDVSLLRAGERYAVPAFGDASFASLFLRHPRAFVDKVGALESVVQSETGQQQTMFEWLTVLLGRFEGDLKRQLLGSDKLEIPRSLVEQIREVAVSNPAAADEIRATWSKFAETVAEEPATFIGKLQQAARRGRIAELDVLLRQLEQDDLSAWDAVLEAGIATRFTMEVNTPDAVVAREAPPLIFDGKPALSTFLESARTWLADHSSYDYEHYQQLRTSVRAEDPSGYGDFLAHAYLFAQQGQWRTASILARLASDNASSDCLEPQSSNGRESAYLEAHCLRVLAEKTDDLAAPQRLVELASRIAMQEGENAGSLAFDPVPERFEVERLALRVAAVEFEWLEKPASLEASAPAALALAREYSAIALSVRPRLARQREGSVLRAALIDVLIRCCRAALALVLQFGNLRTPDMDEFDELHRRLSEMASGPGPRAEITGAVLKLYSAARSAPNSATRKMLHGFILKHNGNTFDQARFEQMVKQIKELHGIS